MAADALNSTPKQNIHLKFEVLKVTTMNITVFWGVTSLVYRYRRLGGTSCLQLKVCTLRLHFSSKCL